MSNEQQHKTSEEVKFEALAVLINQHQEDDNRRWHEFREQWNEFKKDVKDDLTELKNYNVKQNGNIASAIDRITELEKKGMVHYTNCPLIEKVRVLEDHDLTNNSVKKWVTKAVGFTAGGLSIVWIIFQLVINAIEKGA
jgi:hypothetical protein